MLQDKGIHEMRIYYSNGRTLKFDLSILMLPEKNI